MSISNDITQWKQILGEDDNKIIQRLMSKKYLILSNSNIDTLPDSVGELTQLEELSLLQSNIRNLPESIGQLTQLKCLNLYECDNLHNLPDNIGNLYELKYLWVNYKNIEKLPLTFSKLTNLQDNCLRIALSKIDETQDNGQREKLLDILLCVLKIREELMVYDAYSIRYNFNTYEKVSHYTTPDTAIKLLKKENNDNNEKKSSPLRMYGCNQLNDPSEGKLIYDFFNSLDTLKNNNIDLQPVLELTTCLASFSFNQDSLNQFRLYGKDKGKEATGVSIGLKPDFFHYLPSNLGEYEKFPLYRCIYFDPKVRLNNKPYIRVATCDEVSFYQQGNQHDWKSYYRYIRKIEKNVTDLFMKIERNIQSIFTNIEDIKIRQQIIETISFILLPLSFMVKHVAYKEEQECRIFLFTDFNHSDKITIEEIRMYSNYLHINDYVEKIYLSPGAKKYADIFRELTLNQTEIIQSDKPFRIN
ncbi:MAG: leucine-rich repeat domain-containing protein [Neisseriaceae bacterium]|nr:leucine-rich repeat domain-containing protein [Neisseriaceae bacterium]